MHIYSRKLESLNIRGMAVVISWSGAFVVLMVSIVIKGFQQTLSPLTLNRVFSLNNFGFWRIRAVKLNEKPLSVENKIAVKIIKNTPRCVDGRYEVGMLWKEREREFPNDVAMGKHRLQCLRHRLTKPGNEEMAVKYREVMDSYLSSGFVRKLSEEELNKESKTHWYVPHHPETSPTKPGKVRIVFDAAAECEGTSLNKNLLTGPEVANNLVGVILCFRQGKIALPADIEKMFHQIRVREEDQDSMRFLRWTNRYDNPPDTYVHASAYFRSGFLPLYCKLNFAPCGRRQCRRVQL